MTETKVGNTMTAPVRFACTCGAVWPSLAALLRHRATCRWARFTRARAAEKQE